MHLGAHPPGYLQQTSYFFPPFTSLANRRPDLLEMADLSLRRYGNVPQRRAVVLPRVAKCIALIALEAESPETGADLATAEEEPTPVEEHVMDTVLDDKVEKTSNWPSKKKTSECSESSEKWKRNPHKSVKALLKRLRIHPEAQRILGNSRIAVVSLERLNIKSVLLSSAQPVVCLARLPRQKQTELRRGAPLNHPQQNGFNQGEADVWGIREGSPQSKPEEPSDLSQAETTAASWTEPYCPDSSSSEEPEQDSGFDCESNPDHQQYILCDSGSDDGKTHSETFYLDPDADQTLVIQLDPQAGQGRCLQLGGGSGAKQEADVVQVGDSEDQRADLCCWGNQADSPVQQWDGRAEREEMESDDFCAVCSNGGDLLCCDRCPKVYHVDCHIPPLTGFPVGDWMCTLCRTDQEPVEAYDCEDLHSCVGVKAPYTLSNQDQRRCERLTLQLYCHTLSAPFHEPVSSLARNYYQIIKRPIDLSVIRRKLDKSNTLHYFTAEQFVDDVFLMFKNCATFNYPDSEVAQAGRSLEVFFLGKLKEVFPDRTFPSASQVRTDKARRRWLSRKRRENYRKKKCAFPGKKYYL